MGHDEVFIEFINRVIKKEKAAWYSFIDKYNGLIYNYIYRTLRRYNYYRHDDTVEEIFSRVLLALLEGDCKRLRNFRGDNERTFLAYLRVICFNLSIDFLREQKDHVMFEKICYNTPAKDHFRVIETRHIKEAVYLLVKDLPERQRHLFKLMYRDELNTKEIAEIMKLKINALYQLKFRMENNLFRLVKKHFFQEVNT